MQRALLGICPNEDALDLFTLASYVHRRGGYRDVTVAHDDLRHLTTGELARIAERHCLGSTDRAAYP